MSKETIEWILLIGGIILIVFGRWGLAKIEKYDVIQKSSGKWIRQDVRNSPRPVGCMVMIIGLAMVVGWFALIYIH